MLAELPLVLCVFIIFAVAVGISALFVPLAIRLAPKIGAIDMPKARGMHSKPMPRFGGLAIFVGSMAAMFLFLPMGGDTEMAGITIYRDPRLIGIFIGGAMMFLMGAIDDVKNLSAKTKLAGQIAAAVVLYLFNVKFSVMTIPFFGKMLVLPWWVSLIFTVIWVVAITNTINLIDGLDGLAGGVSAISAVCVAYTAYFHGWYLVCIALLALAGGAVGFLFFNFHPAKIFMGDSGALYLGFMISGISILNPMKVTALTAVVVPMIVLALPIFDTVFAILRRKVNHRPIMEADKGHIHHRIMSIGMGQRRTVLTMYGISGVMGMAGVLISRDLPLDAAALLVISGVFIYVFLVAGDTERLRLRDLGGVIRKPDKGNKGEDSLAGEPEKQESGR